MKNTAEKPLGGKELVDVVVRSAQEKLAEEIVVIDISELHGTADWFIICQGDNTVHNSAIAGGIVESTKELGTRPWREEGSEEGRWVLIDYSDVVVHIMLPELRTYYDLEELWSKGKRTDIPGVSS